MIAKKISTNNYEITANKGYHKELKKWRIDLQKMEDNRKMIMDHMYKDEELKALKSIMMAQHERIKELGGFDE